jgi:hypothetical protein
MAAQMPEVVPTAAGQEPPPQQKLLELSKEKCIGLWNCSVCAEGYNDTSDLAWTEEKPYTTQKTSENGELVCSSCIKGEFIKALPALATEFDHSFPAKWGTEELHINDFPEMFFWEHDFHTKYEEHHAKYSRELRDLDDAKLAAMVPDGLVRGRDFQRCNGCKEAIGLRDGCNHMTCTKCGHNFCFICGKDAKDDSGHWIHGACPRWGQPGEQNAWFADPILDDVNPDIEMPTEISFEVWSWNMLIQTTDAAMRTPMQRVLLLSDDAIVRAGPPTDAERESVITAMFRYHPQHGVTVRAWQRLVRENRFVARRFIEVEHADTGLNRLYAPESPTCQGVLSHRAGGVFNMVDPASRREAYAWAHRRQRFWHPDEAEHPDNFAIFDIGPGEAVYPQIRAAQILELLRDEGAPLTDGQVLFERISTQHAHSIFVTITGHGYEAQRRSSMGGIRLANPLVGVNFLFVDRDDPMLAGSGERLNDVQRAQDVRLRAQSELLRVQHPDQQQVDRDATNAYLANYHDHMRHLGPDTELPAPPATAHEAQGTIIGNGDTMDAQGNVGPLIIHTAEEILQDSQEFQGQMTAAILDGVREEQEQRERLERRLANARHQGADFIARIRQLRNDLEADIASGAALMAAAAEEDGGVPVHREEDDEEDGGFIFGLSD